MRESAPARASPCRASLSPRDPGRRTLHAVTPRAAVALECLRALGGALAAPFHLARYALAHERLRDELVGLLERPAAVEEPGRIAPPRDRPLELFVSCAEPSGEMHAARLVAALRAALRRAGAPPPRVVGLGGAALAAAGVELLADPVARAAMGADVLRALPFYLGLLTRAAEHLERARPDLCLLVDSPALHVPLARLARGRARHVVHFATPQHWAWAPWRVHAYREAVDLALTILPFEPAWFRARGVRVAHVGHPLLDDYGAERLAPRAPGADGDLLVLLPGSREGVVRRNLPWMLAAASRLRLALPSVEVAVLQDRPGLEPLLAELVARSGAAGWARVEVGELSAGLARARAALSVSGTVLVDLLCHRVPAVVVYRLRRRLAARLAPRALTVPWFSSVNLLAGAEVYPEFCFAGEGPVEEVERALERCYNDPAWRERCRAGLAEAARRLGPPGATERAAGHALALLQEKPCRPSQELPSRR